MIWVGIAMLTTPVVAFLIWWADEQGWRTALGLSAAVVGATLWFVAAALLIGWGAA